jgi:hypothetical protein
LLEFIESGRAYVDVLDEFEGKFDEVRLDESVKNVADVGNAAMTDEMGERDRPYGNDLLAQERDLRVARCNPDRDTRGVGDRGSGVLRLDDGADELRQEEDR